MDLDAASKARLKLIYPEIAVRVVRLLRDMKRMTGRQMKISEGLRTFERQEELYSLGRTRPGKKVTNAKPGESLHHYGCALDICFAGVDPYLETLPRVLQNELWGTFGKLAHAYGFEWGGDWNGNGVVEKNDFDRPHIQLTYGLQPSYIRELHRTHGMRGVWAAFDKIRGVNQGQEWASLLASGRLIELRKRVV